MEISTRPHWTAGTAVTAAAITLAPLIAGPSALHAPTLPISLPPAVSVPQVQLAAVISPTDIDNLVDRLNSALASVSSTVTAAVAMPANSLTSALDSAVSVNNSLWDGLIDATDNRSLVDLLNALRATSSGSLSRLSTTVGDTGAAVVLTTGEVTDLLASALTGSLSTALHAVRPGDDHQHHRARCELRSLNGTQRRRYRARHRLGDSGLVDSYAVARSV